MPPGNGRLPAAERLDGEPVKKISSHCPTPLRSW